MIIYKHRLIDVTLLCILIADQVFIDLFFFSNFFEPCNILRKNWNVKVDTSGCK